MSYLLGIDIGTSGTKTIIVDERGNLIASATEGYALSTPQPNWAEQDPDEWWRATQLTVRRALQQIGNDTGAIAGIGLSGQMHGSVFLDEKNNVLRPALLWCDQRTQAQCDWITAQIGESRLIELVSNPALTGFTAPKILWVRDHEPEIYKRINHVLLPKDYIRFKLTGIFAGEVSDASGTLLFDVTHRRWSDEVLHALDIPRAWMPEVYESPVVSGTVSKAAAEATGLREGTPVVGGAGDQAAGAVGNGIVSTGLVSSTIGSSGVVFAFTDRPVLDPLGRVHTFCHAIPDKWHVMGVTQGAGLSMHWFRDNFAGIEMSTAALTGDDIYDLLTREAAQARPGSEGLIFLPYLMGERTPHLDANAKGVFFGLTARHTRFEMIRSIMEGVTYSLRDSLEILRSMNVPITQIRASGGGARSTLWRQIQADVFDTEMVTINALEGPAFGVALLAGVGAGIYKTVEEACQETITVVDSIKPVPNHVVFYDRYYQVYRSLYPALKPQMDTVSKIVAEQLMGS